MRGREESAGRGRKNFQDIGNIIGGGGTKQSANQLKQTVVAVISIPNFVQNFTNITNFEKMKNLLERLKFFSKKQKTTETVHDARNGLATQFEFNMQANNLVYAVFIFIINSKSI